MSEDNWQILFFHIVKNIQSPFRLSILGVVYKKEVNVVIIKEYMIDIKDVWR